MRIRERVRRLERKPGNQVPAFYILIDDGGVLYTVSNGITERFESEEEFHQVHPGANTIVIKELKGVRLDDI